MSLFLERSWVWKNLLVTTPRNLGVTVTLVQSFVNIKWFWLFSNRGRMCRSLIVKRGCDAAKSAPWAPLQGRLWTTDWQTFPKGQVVVISGSVAHTVSVTTYLWCFLKMAIDNLSFGVIECSWLSWLCFFSSHDFSISFPTSSPTLPTHAVFSSSASTPGGSRSFGLYTPDLHHSSSWKCFPPWSSDITGFPFTEIARKLFSFCLSRCTWFQPQSE